MEQGLCRNYKGRRYPGGYEACVSTLSFVLAAFGFGPGLQKRNFLFSNAKDRTGRVAVKMPSLEFAEDMPYRTEL